MKKRVKPLGHNYGTLFLISFVGVINNFSICQISEERWIYTSVYLLVFAKSVKSGGYIPRRFASRYISTTIHLPFGE